MQYLIVCLLLASVKTFAMDGVSTEELVRSILSPETLECPFCLSSEKSGFSTRDAKVFAHHIKGHSHDDIDPSGDGDGFDDLLKTLEHLIIETAEALNQDDPASQEKILSKHLDELIASRGHNLSKEQVLLLKGSFDPQAQDLTDRKYNSSSAETDSNKPASLSSKKKRTGRRATKRAKKTKSTVNSAERPLEQRHGARDIRKKKKK